jgi:pimeloyl-ACP methyl ester carboxylesterase
VSEGVLLSVREREKVVVRVITVMSADGTTIASDRAGDGPPLVLVAGALTARAAFAPLVALLAPHFTVYAYDRRGRGDSGDTQPYAIEREIEDLAAVIAAAGGSAYAFGHSSGGALALDTAGRGLGIGKLAIYEPPFFVGEGRSPMPADFATHLARLVAEDHRDDALAYWMANIARETPESMAQWRDTPVWRALASMVHTTVYDVAITAGYMSGAPLPTGAWPKATMPTLVMTGELSPAWMLRAADAVAELLPDARRHAFAGVGHGVPPDQVAPVLLEFFKGAS